MTVAHFWAAKGEGEGGELDGFGGTGAGKGGGGVRTECEVVIDDKEGSCVRG